MPVKIRLARHGKKGYAFYHIVVADSRSPRDGKFIEKLGTYNPNTNPATIELNFDSAVNWLQKGAQPTDTARAILSYKGVMYKKHLLGGVAKGAFSEEEAQKRFDKWMNEKAGKISSKEVKLPSSSVIINECRKVQASSLDEYIPKVMSKVKSKFNHEESLIFELYLKGFKGLFDKELMVKYIEEYFEDIVDPF